MICIVASEYSNRSTPRELNKVLDQALSQLRNIRESRTEPIAIVGVGCRFPGASSPAAFWELLNNGLCEIRDTPQERWTGIPLQNSTLKGGITAHRGSYLQDVDQFDASFFNLSRREANLLDPQQRLLLEVAWETLENAGINPEKLKGSQTGVYVGICTNDYLHLFTRRKHLPIDAWLSTGNAHGSAAGRLSYFFDWRGPCLAVDTACSSSLVAVHLAVQAIRNDECQTALACGVNLMLAPDLSISLSQAGMLSPEGLCKTFSESADGFVRGEGCGAVLLKRLSQARADGDPILCVIRGSASNQDGRSIGLTAPNGLAQQAVIRNALANARVAPEDVSYIEAHGTGTPLGDPVEMSALEAVFKQNRSEDRPLTVGSVKTNLGHLEGAAGIAGVIKTALALSYKVIPPHLHYKQPSSKIHWAWPVKIPTEARSWDMPEPRPRIAGVSSFGFGGTNAHVVLAEAPRDESTMHADRLDRLPVPLLKISAKSPAAVRDLANSSIQQLRDFNLEPTCYTSCVGRSDFDYRLVAFATNAEAMQNSLAEWVSKSPEQSAQQSLHSGKVQEDFHTVWLFSDRMTWSPGFGRSLYESHALFRRLWDQIDEILGSIWPRNLKDLLWKDAPLLQQDRSIALVAIQYLYSQLWLEWGFAPREVRGTGFGELAAGCVAGLLEFKDALQLAVDPQGAEGLTIKSPRYVYRPSRIASEASHRVSDREYWRQATMPQRTGSPFPLPAFSERAAEIRFGDELHANSTNGRQTRTASHVEGIAPRDEHGWDELLKALARLYVSGASINWNAVFPTPVPKVVLPNYPFQRKRYWLPDDLVEDRARQADNSVSRPHPFLGREIAGSQGQQIFEMDLNHFSYLQGHKLRDVCLCPLTAYLEMALAGAIRIDPGECTGFCVSNLAVSQPLFWQAGSPSPLRMTITPNPDRMDCRFEAKVEQEWRRCATCTIEPASDKAEPVEASPALGGTIQDVDAHYERCKTAGLVYSGEFRCLDSLSLKGAGRSGAEAWGSVRLPKTAESGYHFHPALLDGCLQVTMVCLDELEDKEWIPAGIEQYLFYRPPTSCNVTSFVKKVYQAAEDRLLIDLDIIDEEEKLAAGVLGLTFRKSPRSPAGLLRSQAKKADPLVRNILDAADEEVSARIGEYVRSRLAAVLELAESEVELSRSLIDMGMDSLMAIELRNDLQADLGIDFSMEELLDVLTANDLIDRLNQSLGDRSNQDPGDAASAEWVEGVL